MEAYIRLKPRCECCLYNLLLSSDSLLYDRSYIRIAMKTPVLPTEDNAFNAKLKDHLPQTDLENLVGL